MPFLKASASYIYQNSRFNHCLVVLSFGKLVQTENSHQTESQKQRKQRKRERKARKSSSSKKMSKFFSFLVICAITLMIISISSSTVRASGGEELFDWVPKKKECKGSIAECLDGEEEFDLDSEINRRILATTRYISYNALKRNTVPCSRRGASYYNCRPGAQANPYQRGCSAITRCRS